MASVRDAFFTEIYNQVRNGENIYVITADLGAPSLDEFRRDYPNRYISVGIAEQNLIQVAAGMIWGGVNVVAYGLNPFPVTRAFDQIRCLLGELRVPLTLCVLNAGLCAAECGYTHMPIENMAMLRTLSNIEIYNPSDETISTKLAMETGHIKKPRIICFDKSISGIVYNDAELDLENGFSILGCNGESELGVITNGCYVKELSQVCAGRYRKIKLIDLYKLPVDEEALCAEIKQCNRLITVEENVKQGGLGSMVLEIMADHGIYKAIDRFALNLSNGYYDVFTNRNFIRKAQKISINYLLDVIDEYINEEVV